MGYISGKWKWNEDIWDKDENGSFQAQCLFVSNGQSFNDLAFSYNARWDYYSLIYTLQGSNEPIEAAWSDQGDTLLRFGEQEYRTIDFGAEGCPILEDAYYFILANAQPVYGIAEKLQYIAENTQRVYDKGYQEGNDAGYDDGKEDGKAEGRAEGKAEGLKEGYDNGYQDGLVSSEAYEKGKQAEHDAFWNMIQDHGNRTDYGQAFRNWRSSTEYLRPKYKVVPTAPTSAMNTFYNCEGLKKVEAEYFDFSKKARGGYQGSGWYHTFTACDELEEIEDIGIMPDTDLTNTFAHCPNLKKIAMIRVDVNTVISSGIFEGCKSLESVTFDGEIGYGMNLKWSTKLNLASMQNIVACLAELAEGVSGKTLTLSETAVNAIRGVSGADFVTPSAGTLTVEWLNIQSEAQRKGWDIVLA